MNIEKYDSEIIYCPKLGHNLNFKYCRTTVSSTICNKIRDCWFTRIEIDNFLKQNYDAQTIEKISQPSTPKTLSLIELINKAKQYKTED